MTEQTEQKIRNSAGRCIVIGAGDLTIGELNVKQEDLVISVDGGWSYCGILGLEPDYLIGDFDSVSEADQEEIAAWKANKPERVITLNPQKDDTDMLAALRLGLDQGFNIFQIYAGTGGRLDHTIANIQSLLFLKKRGAAGYLMDGGSMIFVMKNEEVRFRREMEGYLSLFAMDREVKGVNISGMKYPLENYTMRNDYPIGVSNEFIGEEGCVSVTDGELVGIIQYSAP